MFPEGRLRGSNIKGSLSRGRRDGMEDRRRGEGVGGRGEEGSREDDGELEGKGGEGDMMV